MNSGKGKLGVAAKPRSSKMTSEESKEKIVKIAEVVVDTAAAVETAPRAATNVAEANMTAVANGAAVVVAAGTPKSDATGATRAGSKPQEINDLGMRQRQSRGDTALPASEVTTRQYDGMATYNHGYMESVLNAAGAMARGCEALGTEWMNYAKTSLEDGVATSKALMSCKSVDEVVKIHSGYVIYALDSCLAESVKLSEMSIKLANEIVEPLNSGFAVAIEELARSATVLRSRMP
ncbi:MAG: phasin family protein [Gammaproteobacteria bacterium]|nr:phasin family protein [Gammaproteobacteria bacterium]